MSPPDSRDISSLSCGIKTAVHRHSEISRRTEFNVVSILTYYVVILRIHSYSVSLNNTLQCHGRHRYGKLKRRWRIGRINSRKITLKLLQNVKCLAVSVFYNKNDATCCIIFKTILFNVSFSECVHVNNSMLTITKRQSTWYFRSPVPISVYRRLSAGVPWFSPPLPALDAPPWLHRISGWVPQAPTLASLFPCWFCPDLAWPDDMFAPVEQPETPPPKKTVTQGTTLTITIEPQNPTPAKNSHTTKNDNNYNGTQKPHLHLRTVTQRTALTNVMEPQNPTST